jgi:hypothetical protein
MEHGNGSPDTPLCTIISLADSKAILGLDDREDALSRYCLTTATYTIEHYCKKRLLQRIWPGIGGGIGVAGNVRGSGKNGEHLEASMPENVRLLLELYRRRVI